MTWWKEYSYITTSYKSIQKKQISLLSLPPPLHSIAILCLKPSLSFNLFASSYFNFLSMMKMSLGNSSLTNVLRVQIDGLFPMPWQFQIKAFIVLGEATRHAPLILIPSLNNCLLSLAFPSCPTSLSLHMLPSHPY